VEYFWDEQKAGAIGDEVDLLAYLSNLVGRDPTLTQPGGGNSSLKRQETDFAGRAVAVLRVKGSGTDMSTIGRAGFTGLRLDELGLLRRQKGMSDEELVAFMRATMVDGREPAPSIETPLHSMIPFRFIVHTHDFATQALTDTPHPEARVREALGAEVAYIDYFRPGFPLAQAVMDLGPLDAGARGLVLGRHGLVAWGQTAKSCYDNLHRLIELSERRVAQDRGAKAITRPFGEMKVAATEPMERRQKAVELLPKLRAELSLERLVILHYEDSPEAIAFAGARNTESFVRRGMSTPEHILRCGRVPLYVNADFGALAPADARRAIAEAMTRFRSECAETFARHRGSGSGPMLDPVPRVIVLPGLGLVTAMKDKANAVVSNLCYRHVIRVMEAAEQLGGFRFIDEKDAFEIEYWPLELAKLNQPERELSRQVALVTGAASGIGRAIAERFAREGAHLVLTDINGPALREVAAKIAAACKDPHRVVSVEADARKAADVAASVSQAVLSFGGLDILVCNAGFLHASPIDEVSDEIWDTHFEINVRGYFLMVREAVRVMKDQRRGTIVFNASKGAFAPTVNNAPYASSKAAVAALARNLAAELGPYGIRVNYFNADFIDTPMMRSLIQQRATQKGVSPEAQIAEYRSRNLLGIGPIPVEAVAETALFLASSRSGYTTGAAITIDGGIKEAMPR
jgi:rhamnulose-1-phosphate aldolase/alcohol dehydrogenase